MLDAAPPGVAAYRDFVVAEVDPADPASQDVASWPPAVRDAIRRIDAHDSRARRARRQGP